MRLLAAVFIVSLTASTFGTECPAECVAVAVLNNIDTFTFPPNDVFLFLSGLPLLNSVNEPMSLPIQVHRTTTVAAAFFNLVHAYDPVARDFFGNNGVKFLKCCNGNDQALLDAHRSVALVYMWLHLGRYLGNQGSFEQIANKTRVPLDSFDTTTDPSLPEGWAKIVVDELLKHAATDGWNAAGLDARGMTPMPYEDTLGMCPSRGTPNRWQPLRFSDGNGAFFEQFHVTPHIGRAGRIFALSEEEFARRQAAPPEYNYRREVEKLVRRSAAVGKSSREQAKIELYDQKHASLTPLLIQIALATPPLSTDVLAFAGYMLAASVTAQDSVTLTWKEKLRFDLPSPSTLVAQELGRSKSVLAYAGPGLGTKSIHASQWMPYLSAVPYSEYPSASACVCQASMEVAESYMNGSDLSAIRPKIALQSGASKVQSDFPAKPIVLQYTQTSAIVADCANSRVSAGLHFTRSSTAGVSLCSGLGHQASDKVHLILAGDASGKFGSADDGPPPIREAPARPNGAC